jgi:hypothetical protein
MKSRRTAGFIRRRALSCVKTLVTKIIVAGLIQVIKDVALLKEDESPFAGCYFHKWEYSDRCLKGRLWTVANLQLVH